MGSTLLTNLSTLWEMNCNKNALSTQATVTPFGTHRYESQLMEQISRVHGQVLQEKAVGLPDNLFQCCQQQHSCLINTHKDKGDQVAMVQTFLNMCAADRQEEVTGRSAVSTTPIL